MKYQVLFSLKNNEKIFINVVCCSRDWHFKGQVCYKKVIIMVSQFILSQFTVSMLAW